MTEDIREKDILSHEGVIGLNFIRDPGIYLFRRHYKQGLRSHIMEVLKRIDVEREVRGLVRDGVKWFPRAKPIKMLRVFRTKFKTLEEAFEEIRTVKIIDKYLAPDHVARSDEFLVDYVIPGKQDFILCGLQEYVEGEILDPWGPITTSHLAALFGRVDMESLRASKMTTELLIHKVQKGAEQLIKGVKKMILEADHVPDLAGVGNILLTPAGDIKLVDINNISRVSFETSIKIDDRGYPVCDKSIQALSFLEQKILATPIDMKETIYRTFLDAQRMKEVKILEERFHSSMPHRDYPME